MGCWGGEAKEKEQVAREMGRGGRKGEGKEHGVPKCSSEVGSWGEK